MLLHSVEMFGISPRLNYFVRLRPIQQAFGYAKIKPKNRDEREAEYREKQINFIRSQITSALERRKSLSTTDWKSVVTELQKDGNFKDSTKLNRYVFAAVLSLKPPHDSMQNARNFIEAFDIQYDLFIKRFIIQLYAKKASEAELSSKEEEEVIELYVWNIHLIGFIYDWNTLLKRHFIQGVTST